MPRKKEKKGDIAKYLIRRERTEESKGGTITDPSRMFQLNRVEGMGQGEAGPTHDTNRTTYTKTNEGHEKEGKTTDGINAHAYGGPKGDRKGERDARLGPRKSKSPQKATPSDDEETWGTLPCGFQACTRGRRGSKYGRQLESG